MNREYKVNVLEIDKFNFMFRKSDVFLFNNTTRVMYKESDTFKVCSDEELPKEGTFIFRYSTRRNYILL
jgi:hypothetical protein